MDVFLPSFGLGVSIPDFQAEGFRSHFFERDWSKKVYGAESAFLEILLDILKKWGKMKYKYVLKIEAEIVRISRQKNANPLKFSGKHFYVP